MDMATILEIIGYFCIASGIIICLIYGVILVIQAFQESVLWGLGYLFIPFVNLFFIIKFWDETKGPFLKTLIGLALLLISAFLVPEMWNQIEID